MVNKKLAALLLGGLLWGNYHTAQVLNQDLLKEKVSYMNLREESKEIGFIQFKPDNFLDGRTFFSQFSNTNLDPAVQFVLMNEETDQLGYTHYKYQQTFAGTPIEGAEYRLTQGPKGLTFAGGFVYDIRTAPQVSLNVSSAISKALSFISADTYKWQIPEEELYIKQINSDPLASFYPKQERVILPVESAKGISFKLTYKLDIYAHAPMSRNYVYVDAADGNILSSISRIHSGNELGSGITLYNGTQNFHADSYSGGYRLKEAVPVNGVTRSVYTKNMKKGTNYASSVEFQDADNNWTDNTNQDRAGWSAHWGAEATWDYYFYQLGRNSYDNAGATINSFVHYDNNYNNAFWDGTRMTYGDGDGSSFSPLVGLDVVGHEITHAVTERTSNLRYQNESGALNESFSDIFGTAIEFYKEGTAGDWMIGEDFDIQNHVGFRSMSNPKVHGDPDCYKGSNWKNNSVFPNLADDYGGVHSNSGVQNFWFYILSVGKSGTNDKGSAYNVTGIGIAKAAAIAYRNNSTKLSQNSTFADARAGSIASAIELYGAGSVEEIATTNAWYAVGVGTAHPGGGGIPTCSVPTGLSSNTITASSANLTWGSVGSAAAYNVRYRATGTSTWTSTTATSTSKAISGLIASTSYEFQVQADCGSSNTSTFSASQTFTTIASGGGGTPVVYCASKGNSTTDEWIAQIQFGSINKMSGNNSGYADFTAISANVTIGQSYNFTLTPGFSGGVFGSNSYPEYWRIWIDYNQDGDFLDAGEMAYDAGSTSTTAKTGSVIIAQGVLTGSTRMRIQMKYNAAPTSCEAFGYGEVEDYTLVISGSIPPSCVAPATTFSNTITHNSANLTWSAAEGSTDYTVRYRVVGSAWTSTNSASTSKALSGLSASSNYEWQVATVCEGTTSSYSTLATFTTSAVPACDAPSTHNVSNKTDVSASLNWTGSTNASSYDVRYRTVGDSWTNTTSSTATKFISGLTASTTYEWEVTTVCSFGSSAYVAGPNFTTNATVPPPVNYCVSKGNSTTDEWIASVQIGNISNTSGSNAGYKDYTNLSLSSSRGAVVSFTLTPGFNGGILGNTTYPEYWRIWIDYNQDGDFLDAGEMAFDAGATSTTAKSGSFTIPATANTGTTRMRVQMKYNAAPTSCESFAYGEVEDYTVNIAGSSLMANSENETTTSVFSASSTFNIYPNPTNGIVYIESDQFGTVKVMTLSGKIIAEGVLDGRMTVQLNDLAKGIYLIELSAASGKETKRIVLQ